MLPQPRMPSVFIAVPFASCPRSEEQGADPDHGRTLADRKLEVAAHPHRELAVLREVAAEPLPQFAQGGEAPPRGVRPARYGDPARAGSGCFAWHFEGGSRLAALDAAERRMLDLDAWHHPLFFCHRRWNHAGLPAKLVESGARKAVAALGPDGGAVIERYADLPWWRPVWTLDLLVELRDAGLLSEAGA